MAKDRQEWLFKVEPNFEITIAALQKVARIILHKDPHEAVGTLNGAMAAMQQIMKTIGEKLLEVEGVIRKMPNYDYKDDNFFMAENEVRQIAREINKILYIKPYKRNENN